MAKVIGFMEYGRECPEARPVAERINDYSDVYRRFPEWKVKRQASRCMDCGVPFCQSGCPIANLIPDWNDLVHRSQWKEAYERLRATNNFPEFTGRICPAPCESACVLGIIDEPVSIERIEREIIERAFEEGWVVAEPPVHRTGKTVAVVGSGPAGLACADQLNRAGHRVTVLERDDRIGGLLRYGIPDFKLEKWVVDRRIELLRKEGVTFLTNAHVGENYPTECLSEFDAAVLCIGATSPRDLPIRGRELRGIHFALDYLRQQNKRVCGDNLAQERLAPLSAAGKHVIVIGGGDTGSDCIGTANRQGAKSIAQFELLPTPPAERPVDQPWPFYPMILRTSTSHDEGVDRKWSILSKAFEGSNGRIERLTTVLVRPEGRGFVEVPGTEESWPAELVLLAIGYTGPEQSRIAAKLGTEIDEQGNFSTSQNYETRVRGVFAAGDARRGQSLVVWAISEGREAALHADAYLSGFVALPAKGAGDLPRAQ